MDKSKKSILITGISGAGKSTLSKKLNNLGYKAYDLDIQPGLFTMFDKQTKQPMVDYDSTDLEKVMRIEWVCDKNKLAAIIKKESSLLAFYCGDASNIQNLMPLFNKVILLDVGEVIARERLASRTNNNFGRTKEIQDWIMSWKGEWENKVKKNGVIIIDAHQSLNQIAKEVIKKVEEI